MVGDVQVATCDLHLAIDRKSSPKLFDRFLEETLLVVDDAEVVVRTCVARVDSSRQRTENA